MTRAAVPERGRFEVMDREELAEWAWRNDYVLSTASLELSEAQDKER